MVTVFPGYMLGLPIDWWVIIGCAFIAATTVLAVVAKKRQNKKNARPILRKILTIIPIAEGNSPQLGRAVPLIGQSEDTIRAFHPDWEDPDTQTMEDALCLSFLDHELAEFAAKHAPDKVIDILRKTWGKMTERGRQEALRLNLPPAVGELLQRALDPR